MGSRTVWLWIFVASLGVTAFLGVMALLMPRVPYEEELLVTSGLLTGYSLLGLAASLALARARLRAMAWAAVVLLGASLCIWLTLVWLESWIHWRTGETIAKAGGTLTILGVLALHAVLLFLAPLRRDLARSIRLGTVAAAAGGGVIAIALFWIPELGRGDLAARMMGALLIPGALGTIAVPVLARIEVISGREDDAQTLGRTMPVWIRCPRCRLEQEIAANRKDRCSVCGLEFTLRLAEPRCRCGYLLHGLTEPRCPECGSEVPAELWWRELKSPEGGPARPAGPAA